MEAGRGRGGVGLETRVALAICVVLGSALCGRAAADAVRRRWRVLDMLTEDIRTLRIHMTGMLQPVRVALERSRCGILTLVAGRMEGGCSAGEAWRAVRSDATRRGGPADALTEADLQALDGLLDELGQSGRAEQEALLASALASLEALREAARTRAAEADRLYVTLSLLVGLMLALIVI